MKYNILIVDDEQANLRLIERLLSADYNVILAESGMAALDILEKQAIALIITDQRMPGITGVEFLKRAAVIAPQSVRIIITGYTDAEALVEALNSGVVYKYVTKPWINSDLKVTIQRGLQHYEAQRAQRRLQEQYTKAVADADESRSSFRKFVGVTLQLQDVGAYARATRMSKLAADLAQEMQLSPREIEELQLAIFVLAMLRFGGFYQMDAASKSVDHTLQSVTKFEAGLKIVSEVPFLRDVVTSIRQFNERYDGWGYPNRLAGENITPIARIGAIIMAYDEMITPQPDKPAVSSDEAVDNIRKVAGTRFDPRMVGVFCFLIGSSNSANLLCNVDEVIPETVLACV